MRIFSAADSVAAPSFLSLAFTMLCMALLSILLSTAEAVTEIEYQPRLRSVAQNKLQLQFDDQYRRRLDEKACGTRYDACADSTTCAALPGATEGVIEAWEGNPNCKDMGFDFGWKSPDPGCVDHNQTYSGGYLGLTKTSDACTDSNCDTNSVGSYNLDCREPDGNQFKYADITSTVDVYVFVKGGNIGGTLYLLKAGKTYTDLRTPTGQAISHLEFCFSCEISTTPEAAPVSTPTTAVPTTETPSAAPTTQVPSDAPTVFPTGAPTTPGPTPCDTCKEDPVITEIPEGKTVCPGDFGKPLASDVEATDVCGNDLVGSIVVEQLLDFGEDNNTCAGTVSNTWSVKPPGCNDTEPVSATQTITVEDVDSPTFSDRMLPDVVYTCPSDYNESQLEAPFASDNCDTDVDVYPSAGYLDGCNDLDITWVAQDDCGNEATLSQTVKIDDSIPPLLKSDAPLDIILTCGEAFPNDTLQLVFEDNCAGEISVGSNDTEVGGNYCEGNITNRIWLGPSDQCGNQAADVVQEIKVMDQSPPELPTDLEQVNVTCPSYFNMDQLVVPNATDDCSVDVTVEGSSDVVEGSCDDVVVTWTATDECGQTFASHQVVHFTDSEAPVPLNGTAPAAELTLSCQDPVPEADPLIFVDNCADDMEVTAIEEDAGGSFCEEGKKITRKWEGPKDACGNTAAEVTQTILIVDQEAPVLPETVEDVALLCPRDFVEADLIAPVATDDCDEDVVVTSSVDDATGCNNKTVTWTAKDVCGKESSVNQTVYFTDKEPPVLFGEPPSDLTLQCQDVVPEIAQLKFSENCGDDIFVDGTVGNVSGSVCDGQESVRTWIGPTDICGNQAADVTQTVTILDQSAPTFPDNLDPLTFICPQDFSLDELDPPSANDDCTETVNVTGIATPLDKCQDVTITWKATDDCGQATTADQTATFTDDVAPEVVGQLPGPITVGCGEFPNEAKLTFWDYCGGDYEVYSKDSPPDGTVCEGQKFTRTWVGPTDDCGNEANTVTQTITVEDRGPPVLPETMDAILLFCPSDFDEHSLATPNATDDCDKTVSVQRKVPDSIECMDEFDVIWTAYDDCSQSDTVAQTVRFNGTAKPTIACPEETTFVGGSGTFTHVVGYGDCYSEGDISISYDVKCTNCDESKCHVDVESSGTEVTFSDAPVWSKVEWTAKLTYPCGEETVQCSAAQSRGGETMFGEPHAADDTKLISDIDGGANRWGWYQEFTYDGGANNDFSFTMHAGAGQSDLDKGFIAGTVVVTVADCADVDKSSADWSGIGDTGLCITDPEDSHHLHVGSSLPLSKKGDISFAPGGFEAGCCNKNSTCFIAVHGVVEDAHCSTWGCAVGIPP